MKILIVRSLDTKFDSRVLKESISLLKKGHEVSILDWDRDNKHGIVASTFPTQFGVIKKFTFGHRAVPDSGFKKNLFPYIKFFGAIRKFVRCHFSEFNVFHLCDLPTMLPLVKILKKREKKIVYDIFDYFPDGRKWPAIVRKLLVKLENRNIKMADATIICSENRLKQIGKAIPKKLVIIHNSPDICATFDDKPNSRNKSDHISVAYLGLLSKDRYIPEIINIVKNNPRLELHIGGVGALEKFVCKEAANESRITYYGKLPYEEVINIENRCDIILALYDSSIPNNRYSAPNKFYESLALGKMLVMAKGMGFDDFFAKQEFGVTIEPTEYGINSGISTLVSKEAKWAEFSKTEKIMFNEKYSWKIMEERLWLLYDELSLI